MRRKEIDTLLWEQFGFERNVVRIGTTKYFKPKAEESAGVAALVGISPVGLDRLRRNRSRYTRCARSVVRLSVPKWGYSPRRDF